jgi:hypothetical protein
VVATWRGACFDARHSMRAVHRLVLASLPLTSLLAACGDNVEPGTPGPDATGAIDATPGADAAPGPDAAPDAAPDATVDAGSPAVPGDPAVGTWRAGFALPGASGMGARVEALVRADDGIYAGGIFVEVAGVRARNVARWTGTTWAPLGDGVPGWVTAMAVDGDGDLWVAGDLGDGATDNRLARWDGAAWTFIDGAIDGRVEDLAVLPDGSIAIVGNFGTVGGVATGSLAVHDDTGWHTVGPVGFFGASALLVKNGDLCVAGAFETIGTLPVENAACWDGTTWTALGVGLPGGVDVLAIGPDGLVYAGGTMSFLIDIETFDFDIGLAVLGTDDVWRPYAGGVDQGFITEVRGLAWRGDTLYVTGDFQSAGAPPVGASRIARHDATGWKAVGAGVENRIGVYLNNLHGGHDLLVVGDTLWIGGVFSVAGGTGATNVATIAVDDTFAAVIPAGATALGTSGFVEVVTADGEGRIIAGGYFSHAGTVSARNVARLGTAGWEALGAGFNDSVLALRVRADGTIVAGGTFSASGGAPLRALAVWNGSAWGPLGGVTPDGPVRSIVEDGAGNLYIGGYFEQVGTVAAAGVARWDGQAWTAVGAGFDGRVYALAWADGALIAGGEFANSGATAVHGVARWTGTAWAPVGGGLVGKYDSVGALAAVDGGFVAGGQFTVTGTGGAVTDLARWDGMAWQAVGAPLGNAADLVRVTTILPYRDGLFAGGIFDRAGEVPASGLAWFDGTAWHDLDGGLDDLPTGLAVVGATLWVGGTQIEVGGRVSSGLAAWDFPQQP